MQHPVFSLDAVLRKDLGSATKVFSIHDMEYFLWIRVSPEIAKDYRLYELDEVDLCKKYDLDLPDMCNHEPGRIWYSLNSMLLNRDPGQHVYRMHMVNNIDNTTTSLYFAYVVQREDTEKSYIYMPNLKEQDVVKI